MKTIGIVGSRRRDSSEDWVLVHNAFIGIFEDGDRVVSGGCRKGADRFAEELAEKMAAPMIIHKADWKKYGKTAGFIRNTDIVKDADILIACVAPDRTGGTEDTVRKFMELKGEWRKGDPAPKSKTIGGKPLLILI